MGRGAWRVIDHGVTRVRHDLVTKSLMLGKTEGRRRRGTTEDEMVGMHHQLNGHEFEQTLGDSDT